MSVVERPLQMVARPPRERARLLMRRALTLGRLVRAPHSIRPTVFVTPMVEIRYFLSSALIPKFFALSIKMPKYFSY